MLLTILIVGVILLAVVLKVAKGVIKLALILILLLGLGVAALVSSSAPEEPAPVATTAP